MRNHRHAASSPSTSKIDAVNKPERTTFERCALISGLLSEEQIEEARTAAGWSAGDEPDSETPSTEQHLADRLVEIGYLNPWQAKQLLDGRTKFNLGPYEIVDSIGQGGMGQVFKAEHGVMGRTVAIKVLPLNKTTPDAVVSFTREIRALASLDHHRLVRALDAGQDGNVYYLVTEYIPGSDLRKLVRRDGPLPVGTAAWITYQIAEGLHYAHGRGLVHRDVKPANVLVTPNGAAKLSDLGLAGPLGGDAENDPRYGKIVGTADYISPDHIKSPWEPTPAWDIYSLGCTLYYAITGKVPFPGGSTSDKARAHCDLRPLDPRRMCADLSDEFVDMLADMMAKSPVERVPSAAAVMARLEPWIRETRAAEYGAPTALPPVQTVVPPIAAPPAASRPIPIPAEPPRRRYSSDAASTFQGGPTSDEDDDDSSSLVLQTTDQTNGSGARRSVGPILRAVLLWIMALLAPIVAVGITYLIMR